MTCCSCPLAGVVERCKLLDVQYISKQYTPQEQQPDSSNPFREHQQQQQQPQVQATVLTVRLTLQRLSSPRQQLLLQQAQLRHCHDAAQQECCSCQERNRTEAELPQQEEQQHCSWASGAAAVGCCQANGGGCHRAYICSLEYPVFHLEGNDYVVAAATFDRGMADWSRLGQKDEFSMLWDGNQCM